MLVPVASIAPRAILPDDPGVALRLATTLLEGDRLMANHHRGLWGYTGSARDGLGPLTIQSTGVGAASAGLVLNELLDHGLQVAIRAGTARGHSPALTAGELYAVTHAQGAGEQHPLDRALTAQLTDRVPRSGTVRSCWSPGGQQNAEAEVTDLETAELAQIAQHAGIAFAAVLAISATEQRALDHEAVAEAVHSAGVVAGAALGSG